MKYARPKRKPDFETESFRMWNKKQRKETKKDKEEYKNNLIKYKDIELSLCGFTIARDKTTKEIIFAYKIKPEHNVLMYYMNEKFKDEERTKILHAKFLDLSRIFGFDFHNLHDTLENLQTQKHLLKKNLKNEQ